MAAAALRAGADARAPRLRFPAGLTIDLITPEPEPLGVFGAQAAEEVAELIGQAAIQLRRDTVAAPVDVRTLRFADGRAIQTDRTVTLALPRGPHIPGLPSDADEFVPCDRHGCVHEREERTPSAGNKTRPAMRPGSTYATAGAERGVAALTLLLYGDSSP
jgi:sulfide:quinone oxidoreductase